MIREFKDIYGKEITEETVRDGLVIKQKRPFIFFSRLHRLHNIKKGERCNKCGFPAMEIIERDNERQIMSLGCPWCRTTVELTLKSILVDQNNK